MYTLCADCGRRVYYVSHKKRRCAECARRNRMKKISEWKSRGAAWIGNARELWFTFCEWPERIS